MTTDLAVKSATVEIKSSGAFEVIFATKRDVATGDLIIDADGDVYGDEVIGTQPIYVGCWNHQLDCPGPAGVGETVESFYDLRAKGRLLLETQHGADEYARWRALGSQAKFSYVFRILDAVPYTLPNGRQVRMLLKLEVLSIDLVANPAGVGTQLVSLKSGSCACGCGGECSHDDLNALVAEGKALIERLNLEGLRSESQELIRKHTKHAYIDVDASTVDPIARKTADWVMSQIAENWGVGAAPELTWMKLASPEERDAAQAAGKRVTYDAKFMSGSCNQARTKIHVDESLASNPYAVAATVAHEMHHAEVGRKRRDPNRWDAKFLPADEEAECREYGYAFAERYADGIAAIIEGA